MEDKSQCPALAGVDRQDKGAEVSLFLGGFVKYAYWLSCIFPSVPLFSWLLPGGSGDFLLMWDVKQLFPKQVLDFSKEKYTEQSGDFEIYNGQRSGTLDIIYLTLCCKQ